MSNSKIGRLRQTGYILGQTRIMVEDIQYLRTPRDKAITRKNECRYQIVNNPRYVKILVIRHKHLCSNTSVSQMSYSTINRYGNNECREKVKNMEF